jgi:hypothetical protein
MTGYKKYPNPNVASKPMQKIKHKWKKTPAEAVAYDKPPKQKQGKLNLKVSSSISTINRFF